MPTTYQHADADVRNLIVKVMEKNHARLSKAGVKIGALFALNPEGEAVKHAGYAALAKIKPVALKDRVSKEYDAELIIDEKAFRELKPAQQASLIDHELSHIDTIDIPEDEVARSKFVEGDEAVTWKTDDLGRPKLKSVNGDWNVGDGFTQVVARHGEMAIEYENIRLAKGRADAARESNGHTSFTKEAIKKFVDGIPEGLTVEVSSGGKTSGPIKGRGKRSRGE